MSKELSNVPDAFVTMDEFVHFLDIQMLSIFTFCLNSRCTGVRNRTAERSRNFSTGRLNDFDLSRHLTCSRQAGSEALSLSKLKSDHWLTWWTVGSNRFFSRHGFKASTRGWPSLKAVWKWGKRWITNRSRAVSNSSRCYDWGFSTSSKSIMEVGWETRKQRGIAKTRRQTKWFLICVLLWPNTEHFCNG
jgi:hypothetical protein